MKKIFQISTDLSLKSGGQRTVVLNIHNYINNQNGYSSSILTNKKEDDDDFKEFASSKFKFWNFSNEFSSFLKNNINNVDLAHLHGVFMHTQYLPSKLAHKNNIPYLLTAHGMLEPWYLNDKKLKKSVYLNLILHKILKRAKFIHAITPSEKENLFKLTNHKNIVEIPNFINFSKIQSLSNYDPEEEYLLHLGRIHPGKGIDILIKSMSKIENKKIKLKIVGSPSDYSIELKKLCVNLNIENRVEFLGGIYGNDKNLLFANAKAFIAPSYSEAIGMVNLEAAACKTPVVTTFNTGINKDWNNCGGIMINPNVEELVTSINSVNSWTTNERIQRGESLSKFVENNYSWEKKGYLWNELYDSI